MINTKTIDTEGKKNEKEQIITKIEIDGTEGDCYKNVEEIKKNMVIHGRNRVAMYPPGGDHRAKELRKMVECIFQH